MHHCLFLICQNPTTGIRTLRNRKEKKNKSKEEKNLESDLTSLSSSFIIFFRIMAAPPQQQTTPSDHHYFEWSTTKQQKLVEQSLKVVPIGVNQQQISTNNTSIHNTSTNNTTNMVHNHPHLHNHPLMTHTHRRHYYQHFEEKRSFEDSKQKQNKTTSGIAPSTMSNPANLSPSSTNCNTSGHIRKKQKTNINGIGSASSTSSLNTSDDHIQSQQQQSQVSQIFIIKNKSILFTHKFNYLSILYIVIDLLSISS